jgi:hypothetical protein
MLETNFFWDPLSDNILQERDETDTVTAVKARKPVPLRRPWLDPRPDRRQQTGGRHQCLLCLGRSGGPNRQHYQSVPLHWQEEHYKPDVTGELVVRRRLLFTLLGRWLAVDPFNIGDSRPSNHVGNDTLRLIDPSGLFAVVAKTIEDRTRNNR